MKNLYITLFLLLSITSYSQKNILIYHETNGFRHSGAISSGITMFEEMGDENNQWNTDNSQDSNVFNTSNLAQYDAVIFLNTSGNDLLSAAEQSAFEAFIGNGKGFIGIHAATDTYRNGDWDFYNQLVGGIVQTGPNHTSNNFNADMTVLVDNSITGFLGSVGSTWNKNEEYYYWQNNGGQLSADNTVLLEVEQTGSNSYDAARPITWLKESLSYDDDDNGATPEIAVNGFRSFYTALGHNGSDYSGDSNFRALLKNAVLWTIGDNTLSTEDAFETSFKITPNPTKSNTRVYVGNASESIDFKLYNVLGKQVLFKTINPITLSNQFFTVDLSRFNSGMYIAKITSGTSQKSLKLIKN